MHLANKRKRSEYEQVEDENCHEVKKSKKRKMSTEEREECVFETIEELKQKHAWLSVYSNAN